MNTDQGRLPESPELPKLVIEKNQRTLPLMNTDNTDRKRRREVEATIENLWRGGVAERQILSTTLKREDRVAPSGMPQGAGGVSTRINTLEAVCREAT
jgi:hypothetical protein